MKHRIAITTAALVLLGSILSPPASAGPARRHTIEGFVLGAGVTLLGTAIIRNMSRPDPVVVHDHSPRHREHHSRGHWKTERVWVPAATETRWNPGHYDPSGRWVEGRYQEFVVSQGHWEKRKVWISKRHRY